ncbi:uncharacterized protein LOC109819964 isoform X2 [Asparagus officinalis]|uniref:uncharacterized protein LOC109819964 isoform X1 n=1 Tax=Asparagus officinalis TaxID=4686 RepID=UPI00098E56A0|nr:uncharacterized protein LOC109819964 isoform X1 [Asparagus officinalis]XP_020241570.1 uncharacterized protein LOC109819964 isoform X2 [Asparagus officinalis]
MKKMKRMVLSATIYWIWKERNTRIFQEKCRRPDQLVREVKLSVMMKVLNEDIPEHLRGKIEKLPDAPSFGLAHTYQVIRVLKRQNVVGHMILLLRHTLHFLTTRSQQRRGRTSID